MDLTTLLKDLDGAVEKIHQIQANLTRFAVEESDVKLKNQSENLLCKWSLTRDDQTVKAEHQPKTNRKKAHEQKSPVDKITTYVLFRPYPENPNLSHSHPSQPPFIRISKSKLWSFSSLFGDLLEQKQNGRLRDDDDNIVYDGATTHQAKKYIDDLAIYTTGLIHSYYSSYLDGHDEFSALSDDRVWSAFKNGLRLVEEGYLHGRLLSKRERMDLDLWVEYTNI